MDLPIGSMASIEELSAKTAQVTIFGDITGIGKILGIVFHSYYIVF